MKGARVVVSPDGMPAVVVMPRLLSPVSLCQLRRLGVYARLRFGARHLEAVARGAVEVASHAADRVELGGVDLTVRIEHVVGDVHQDDATDHDVACEWT